MAWTLHEVEGEGAKLAFGQPHSDNVLVMLSCAPGSGAVRVSAHSTASAPQLELASGGRSASYPAQAGPGLGESLLVEASARAADPVLQRFADSGQLTVGVAGQRTAVPTDKAKARAFVARCRA
jgi:hypothetical protein